MAGNVYQNQFPVAVPSTSDYVTGVQGGKSTNYLVSDVRDQALKIEVQNARNGQASLSAELSVITNSVSAETTRATNAENTIAANLNNLSQISVTSNNLVNNLSATQTGFGLDATQGNALQNEINSINTTLAEKAPLASPNFTGIPKANGYNLLEALNGGYKIESGSTSATITTAGTSVRPNITFPSAFTSAPLILLTPAAGSAGGNGYLLLAVDSVTTTGFTAFFNSYVAETLYFNWLAIGV